jgi:hypothetical protein
LFNFSSRLCNRATHTGRLLSRPSSPPHLEALEDRLLLHSGIVQASAGLLDNSSQTAAVGRFSLLDVNHSAGGQMQTANTNPIQVSSAAHIVSTLLPIPPRVQWPEHGGYCGETVIQSFALYYGTYVSQYQARAMCGPNQSVDNQLLVGVNDQKVLNNLHLTSQEWDFEHNPTPQYKDYLAWVKQQLEAGHPVIGTLYINGLHDPDYDHIVPFVGFTSSQDATSYHANDQLLFYDNFLHDGSLKTFTRSFSSLPATRQEANHGSAQYYLPQQVDYGCAVTGIDDPNHETVPVRLTLDRPDEPDLIAGQKPVTLNGTLTISSLVPGRTYDLLRYDDYTKVPDSNFLAAGGYTSVQRFTATATTQTLYDSFESNGCVIYRCVQAPTA